MEQHTIIKKYVDIPFAHRQHMHDGHCKYVHGHNWDFEFTFGCTDVDEQGFVYDFGKLKWLKAYLDDNFDHKCIIAQTDGSLDTFKELDDRGLLDLTIVADTSAEGLAMLLYKIVNVHLQEDTNGRVYMESVKVFEDSHDVATYKRMPEEQITISEDNDSYEDDPEDEEFMYDEGFDDGYVYGCTHERINSSELGITRSYDDGFEDGFEDARIRDLESQDITDEPAGRIIKIKRPWIENDKGIDVAFVWGE